MIAPFGERFRKWLLRVALAVRNGSEVVVSRLASVEKTRVKEDEKKVRPGTIKTARFLGPPDHWIQLVKRHAPELLHPAAPYVVNFSASQVFKEHSDMDAFGAGTRESAQSDEAYGNARSYGDKASSLKSPRFSEEFDTLSTIGVKKTDSNFTRVFEASLKDPTSFPPCSESLPLEPNQSSFIKGFRFSHILPDTEKNDGLKPLKNKNINESANPRKPAATQRRSEVPVARISFATFSPPDTGQVETPGSGKTDEKNARPNTRKNFQSSIRNVRYGLQANLQGYDPQIHFQSDTERFGFLAVKNQTAYDKDSEQTGFFRPAGILETATIQPTPFQIKKHVNEIIGSEQDPMNDRRHQFYLHGKSKTIIDKHARPLELQWPHLQEEDGAESIPDANFPDLWPSLPEEQPLSRKPVLQQKQNCFLKPDTREIERLRRLDKEQKGRAWSALHS
jgi:hypothetical protein